jgi:hypothetical protein
MFQMTRWNALRASPRERSRPGPIAHRLGTTAAGPFKPLTEYLCIDGAPRASLQPKAERLRERAFGKLFWHPPSVVKSGFGISPERRTGGVAVRGLSSFLVTTKTVTRIRERAPGFRLQVLEYLTATLVIIVEGGRV